MNCRESPRRAVPGLKRTDSRLPNTQCHKRHLSSVPLQAPLFWPSKPLLLSPFPRLPKGRKPPPCIVYEANSGASAHVLPLTPLPGRRNRGSQTVPESRWSRCQGSVADDMGERVSGEAPQLDSTRAPCTCTCAEALVCRRAALSGAMRLNCTRERQPVKPGVLYLWISWSIFPVSERQGKRM